jgi:endo-1,4-beta-D-glucanase Y
MRSHLCRGLLALLVGSLCGLSQAAMAQHPWPLWQSYVAHFLSGDGRVVDHTAGDCTTSEGQAYAMFFALADNDRVHFDLLLHWTETNLAGGDLTAHLPAWRWGRNDAGEWKTLDPNPASDADLWLAYDLLEAGRLWHEPRYAKLGSLLAERIAQQEVATIPGLGTMLLPGPTGFHPEPSLWIVNPSYLPLSPLVYLAREQPDGPWKAILHAFPTLLRQGNGAGYAMDWVAADSSIHPSEQPAQIAAENPAQTAQAPAQAAAKRNASETPVGSYDAIRVYLWLGLAAKETPGRNDLLATLPSMASTLKTQMIPPERVAADGKVLAPDGPVGFSAAVLPYLVALGRTAEATRQQDRLTASLDPSTGLYGHSAAYYDQNLILFATGYAERRFHFEKDGTLSVAWR